MSSFPSYFRHRTYGPRCSSPPTFVCYELPQPEPFSRSPTPSSDEGSDNEHDDSSSESNSNSDSSAPDAKSSDAATLNGTEEPKVETGGDKDVEGVSVDKVNLEDNDGKKAVQDTAEAEPCEASVVGDAEDSEEERRRIEKREGKKKEVCDPPAEEIVTPVETKPKEKKRSKRRNRGESPAPPVRPILTIRSSQGFVWNQDLFVPPYIKERYIATSPPSSIAPAHGAAPRRAFRSNNFFSTSGDMDYEVECVEIRVSEGEMDDILPRYR